MSILSIVLTAIVYVLARAGGHETACDLTPGQASVASISPDGTPFDIGAYREQILSKSQPYIIECIEAGEGGGSQEACHLPRDKRYAALNQKGVTLWMTGSLYQINDDIIRYH